jgi:hypothetical protein
MVCSLTCPIGVDGTPPSPTACGDGVIRAGSLATALRECPGVIDALAFRYRAIEQVGYLRVYPPPGHVAVLRHTDVAVPELVGAEPG